MEKELIFSILALFFSFWNLGVYWRETFRSNIIPHPFTFFLWAIVMSITTYELYQSNEVLWMISILPVTLSVYWSFSWWIMKRKLIIIHSVDWFFLFAWIGLIIFWQLEPNYTYVLAIMIGIDAFAYIPSFKKAWLQPFTEKSLPYFLSVFGYIFTILSISVWNFENLGMWVWTACINGIFACFILARQYSMRK